MFTEQTSGGFRKTNKHTTHKNKDTSTYMIGMSCNQIDQTVVTWMLESS